MEIQKLKYLENEKSFLDEIKNIFHLFKGLSVAKNCLRPESAPLSLNHCLAEVSRVSLIYYLEGCSVLHIHKMFKSKQI